MVKKDTTNIDTILKNIDKKYPGARLNLDPSKKISIGVISTSSISLDYATGIGGIPRGRITEIFGNESSGKTTLGLHIIAEAQKKGVGCAFIDAEHSMDGEYAKKLGVDIEKLLIFQPNCGEEGLEICEDLMKTGSVGLIVVDSVPALTPKAEMDGIMGTQFIGLQARLISHGLRKLTSVTSNVKTALVFINQVRMNIGITWGPPTTTPGGKALKFYTSMRIELRRAAKIKKGNDIIGNRIVAKVVKNKLAPPFKETEFDIYFNEGVSKEMDLINFATDLGIIKKEGLTYKFDKEKLGVGLENAKNYLKENPKKTEEILSKVKEKQNEKSTKKEPESKIK